MYQPIAKGFLFCFLVSFFISFSLAFQSCKRDQISLIPLIMESKFDSSYEGWTSGFADYPLGGESAYELVSAHRRLPSPLDVSDGALFISGKNPGQDLFMYWKKKIESLKPNTQYKAWIIIDFASNAPSNWVGIGGSPGENVSLGIGITKIEPLTMVDSGYYRMNISEGNQRLGGPDRKVIGNIANGTDEVKYVLLREGSSLSFTTDEKGHAWVCISTDSGYASTTALFYSKIRLEFLEL